MPMRKNIVDWFVPYRRLWREAEAARREADADLSAAIADLRRVVGLMAEYGRCDGCGAPYLMSGDAVYGWCRHPECDGAVVPILRRSA
jgi:hypothetical protein